MAKKTDFSTPRASRRQAIGVMAMGAALPALAARAQGPLPMPSPPPSLAPQGDLVNVLEYETQARVVLEPARLAAIAGGDRTVTDRITLRPRMNIPTRDLDLTSTLFGDAHFAPIVVGPIARQDRFHPEGEIATARGAGAAKAAMVVSSESSVSFDAIAQSATEPLWLQVDPRSPKLRDTLSAAAKAKAAVVTVNGSGAHRLGRRGRGRQGHRPAGDR